MASELLKRQALINKLKEPNVEDVNFDLANSSLDYSIESITEDILPEPKPAELFQEREKVRSERLLGTLNTLGGGLMDESVDFIKRENFATKGIPGRGADYFTDRITDPTRLKFLDEAAKVYGYKNFSEVPITKQTVPGKRLTGVREKVLSYAKRREQGKPIGKGGPGEPKSVEPDRSGLYKEEVIKKAVATKKKAYQESEVGKRLQWIADNGKNYDNPEEFIKAYEKHFKHKLGSEKDALFHFSPEDKLKSRYIKAKTKMVSINSIDNLQNTGGVSDSFSFKQNFSEPEIFKASIIQNNPKVQKQFKNLFKKIYKDVSEYAELGPEGMIKKLEKDGGKLLNSFDFIEKYESRPGSQTYGGIHRGVARQSFRNFNIPEEHLKAFQSVRQPVLSLVKILERLKLQPQEISKQFNLSPTTAKLLTGQLDNFLAGTGEVDSIISKINTSLGNKKFSEIFQGVNFEHTLAKQFGKDYKYLPRNYLLKGQFTTKAFNLFKRDVFDLPLIRLMKKFEAGEVSADQVKNFIDDFNTKTNNYADFTFNTKKKKLEYTDNKVKYDLSRYANPGTAKQELIDNIKLTMSPEFQKGFKKNRFQDFEDINKKLKSFRSKEAKKILKLLQSVGCPTNKADGGRVVFQDGANCFMKGVKVINEGRLQPGAQTRNFLKFFNTASSIAKKTGQGLRLFTKLAIIPEAAIIGVESTVRMSRGDTLSEALKEAVSYIPGLGGKAEEADLSRVSRYLGKEDAKYVRNLRNFEKAQQELNNVISAQDADVALAGTEFDEMSSGESQTDVVERYKPKIAEKEKALQDASISQPEELFARSLEDEFADIKNLKRGLTGRQKRQELNVIDPEDPLSEDLITPEITQEELNKRIVEQQPTVAEEIFDSLIKDEEDSDLKKQKAQELLNLMLALEEQGVTDKDAAKAVEDARRGQFEDAYLDSALAEQLFGPSRTFGGQPVDLENYVPSDRFEGFRTNQGIYAIGGRVGFAEGPKDPNRRFFLKLMGGIMSIPIIGKFLKPLKPAVKPLSNTTTKMPEWFPQLVEKFTSLGTSKKITKKTPGADLPLFAEEKTIIEVPQLPGVRFEKYDNGVIKIEGKNAYNEPYEIKYEPPGEYKSLETGKIQKTEGDFAAADTVYYRTGDPREMDYDVDYSVVEDLDDILGGDSTKLEGFAKGTGEVKYTKGAKQVDDADAAFDSNELLSDNPAYRPSDARADVIEGPDVDLSDYYDD